MTTFGANETHQTSEQETINHIKKMEKSKSHRPFYTLPFFFVYFIFIFKQIRPTCSPLRSTLPYFHLYVWPAEYLRNPPIA